MSHHGKHKKGWFDMVLCKKHHHTDDDSTSGHGGDDDDEGDEETDPSEKSVVSDKEVRQQVKIEGRFDIIAIAAIQMAFAGGVLGAIVSGSASVIPMRMEGFDPGVIILTQGVFVFIAYLMVPQLVEHYDADIKLLLLSIVMPLLTSDKRMFGSMFSRKHRWSDAWTMLWTRFIVICALEGGYACAGAFVSVATGSFSNIGNPTTTFLGSGPFQPNVVYGIIGFGTAFTYFTFGASRLLTPDGHMRKIIPLLKSAMQQNGAVVFHYALAQTLMFMLGVLFTGSPLSFELLIAGAILTQTAPSFEGWMGSELLGLLVAFLFLFFGHHCWNHYVYTARHAKLKE